MKLYRGDKIFNTANKPNWYFSEGLFTKAFGSGADPTNIEKQGWIESIRRHVHHPSIPDKHYYRVTDFLSFSKSRKRAEYWCADMGKLVLEACPAYEETRYLFTLDIDSSALQEEGNGVYVYNFKCNRQLIEPIDNKEFTSLLATIEMKAKSCLVCSDTDDHHILLIDSYEYLMSNYGKGKYEKAKEFAKRDEEWLVLPLDPLPDSPVHRCTRILRADFWSVEHYKVAGETRP